MSTKIVSPGELEKGMNVTILNWKPIEVESPMGTLIQKSNFLCGQPLEVLAVDLPFVVVAYKGFEMLQTAEVLPLDTRNFTLMELSKEFMEIFKDENREFIENDEPKPLEDNASSIENWLKNLIEETNARKDKKDLEF